MESAGRIWARGRIVRLGKAPRWFLLGDDTDMRLRGLSKMVGRCA